MPSENKNNTGTIIIVIVLIILISVAFYFSYVNADKIKNFFGTKAPGSNKPSVISPITTNIGTTVPKINLTPQNYGDQAMAGNASDFNTQQAATILGNIGNGGVPPDPDPNANGDDDGGDQEIGDLFSTGG